MKSIRFTKATIDRTLVKVMLALSLVTVAGGFALFLDGGARPQGLLNAVERSGMFKYAEIAYIPIAILVIVHAILTRGRYSDLRELSRSTGAKLAAIFLFMTALQWAAGMPISNAMLGTLCSFVAVTFIAGVAIRLLDTNEIFSTLNLVYLACFLLSLFLITFIPSYGVSINVDEDWQGMFVHKNNLGIFCASYALISLGCWRASRTVTAVNMTLAGILVFGSRSYASIAAFFIAALFALSPLGFRRAIVYLRFPILAGALIASAAIVLMSVSSFSMDFFGKDFTFSGRNMIWAYSMAGFLQHPALGQGMNSLAYQVSHNSAGFFNATGQVLASHHNGMISLLYDFGLVGAAAVLAVLQRPLRRLVVDSSLSFMLVSGLVATITLNTFEERLFSPNAFYFALILLIFINETNTSHSAASGNRTAKRAENSRSTLR